MRYYIYHGVTKGVRILELLEDKRSTFYVQEFAPCWWNKDRWKNVRRQNLSLFCPSYDVEFSRLSLAKLFIELYLSEYGYVTHDSDF